MISTFQLGGLGLLGGLFNPFSIFGPGDTGAFYDFTDSATLFFDSGRTTQSTVGQKIFGVTDKSGTGRHLTGGDANIKRQQSGGVDYADFTSSTTALISTSGQVGSASGYFAIISCRPATTASSAYVFDSDQSSKRVSQTIIRSGTSAATQVFNVATSSFLATGGTLTANVDVVMSTLRTATNGDIRVNGAVVATTAGTTTAANFSNTVINIGAGMAGTLAANQLPFSGRVYAALFINRQPTAAEILYLEAWFAAKHA